jgi:hypothetical protein
MATKNKVFFLEFEGDEPEFIRLINVEEGESFAQLRVKLEDVGGIGGHFNSEMQTSLAEFYLH